MTKQTPTAAEILIKIKNNPERLGRLLLQCGLARDGYLLVINNRDRSYMRQLRRIRGQGK